MFASNIRRFGVARASKTYLFKKIFLRCGIGGKFSGVTTPAYRISQPFFRARANATARNRLLELGVSRLQASSRAKMVGIMSENVEQPLPVSVVALRVESYSAADDSIVISFRTKYSTAERKYSVPVDCLEDFIADLRRLSYRHQQWRMKKRPVQTEPLLPLEPGQNTRRYVF